MSDIWVRVATFPADRHDFGIDADAVWAVLDRERLESPLALRFRASTMGDIELWRATGDEPEWGDE